MEVAMTIPLWLVIATCLTFTYKLFLINSSLQEQSKMGTLTFQCIMGNTLHPDLCTVITAPQEQDKPQWRLQKKKKNFSNVPQISYKIQWFYAWNYILGAWRSFQNFQIDGNSFAGREKYNATPYFNRWLMRIKHWESYESSTWRFPKFSSLIRTWGYECHFLFRWDFQKLLQFLRHLPLNRYNALVDFLFYCQ